MSLVSCVMTIAEPVEPILHLPHGWHGLSVSLPHLRHCGCEAVVVRSALRLRRHEQVTWRGLPSPIAWLRRRPRYGGAQIIVRTRVGSGALQGMLSLRSVNSESAGSVVVVVVVVIDVAATHAITCQHRHLLLQRDFRWVLSLQVCARL